MIRLQPSHVARKPLSWTIFWIALLSALGWFDAWRAGKHDGSTLSETTRFVFKTKAPTGRLTFLAFLAGGSAVLARHILK
jgi:hypothetical protein